MYYSVRGWLECSDSQVEQIKDIVHKNADANPYTDSWVFQEKGGGYSRFVFFGCTVNQVSLPEVKKQVQRIATDVTEQDGDITDFVKGIFYVTFEEETPEYIWAIKNGIFDEKNIG